MTRGQRIDFVLGASLAVIALLFVLLATHPEFGSDEVEASWAPSGLQGLITLRGLAAFGLAAAAIILLVIAFRPGRRALPGTFFSDQEEEAIRVAIAAAERETSGEIRVHLASRARGEVRDAAEGAFHALGMDATAARNGVLVYLSVADHRFAIVGDQGIDQVVPDGFWDEIKDGIESRFSRGEFAEGVVVAVERIGEKLRDYFPYQKDDVNELPDEISTE